MAAAVALLLPSAGALHLARAPPTAAHRTTTVRMGGAKPYDYTFITLQPTYTINDWATTQRVMDEYVAAAKTEAGLTYCGYSTTRSRRDDTVVGDYAVDPGDKLFCRAAFPDAEALIAHLSNVQPQLTALIDGPATLDEIQVHGPAAELRKCDGVLEGAKRFEIECGLSRLEKESGGMPLPLQLVSLHTSFTLADADAARAICDAIVAASASEEGCIYCGFTRCGETLHLREAFGSAVGLARHCLNVAELIDALLDGPATLLSGQVHASLSQLPTVREFIEDAGRERGYCSRETKRYYSAEGGYSRFEVQQSMFGFFFRR